MTDWFGWLADDVDTADSRTTWIFEPSLFWRTFSVTLTLRLRRVENPEEHSVSVGEDGQEWAALASPSIEVVPEQMRDKLSTSWWKNGQRSFLILLKRDLRYKDNQKCIMKAIL